MCVDITYLCRVKGYELILNSNHKCLVVYSDRKITLRGILNRSSGVINLFSNGKIILDVSFHM